MKRLILISFVFVLVFSCKKEEGLRKNFDVFAFKNGTEWNATSNSYAESVDTISFQADVFNEYDEWRENLYINNVPVKIGRYNICKSRFSDTSATCGKYFTITHDGDVLDGIFDVCENKDNFIEIIEVDKSQKYMKGVFQVTFIQDTISKPYKLYLPDTIRFTKGTFTTKYK